MVVQEWVVGVPFFSFKSYSSTEAGQSLYSNKALLKNKTKQKQNKTWGQKQEGTGGETLGPNVYVWSSLFFPASSREHTPRTDA